MHDRPGILRAAGVAFLVSTLAGTAAAQTGRVTGVVKDDTGQPIKGATLSLENPDASPRNFTATSDASGRFAVIGLRAGEWAIVAQAPGFESEAGRLMVRSTTPATYTFGLRRAPQPAPSALGNVSVKDLQSALREADRLFNGKQWDQSIAAYREVLARTPALGVVNLQIGAAYRQKKDFDGALAAYNDLLRVDPNNDKAKSEIGLTNMEKGDLKAAEDTLQRAAQSQTASKEVFYSLGEVEQAKGDATAAANWYEKAAANDPSWGKPLLKLGLGALNKGDKTGAATMMQRVIAVDPLSAEAAQARTIIDQLNK